MLLSGLVSDYITFLCFVSLQSGCNIHVCMCVLVHMYYTYTCTLCMCVRARVCVDECVSAYVFIRALMHTHVPSRIHVVVIQLDVTYQCKSDALIQRERHAIERLQRQQEVSVPRHTSYQTLSPCLIPN